MNKVHKGEHNRTLGHMGKLLDHGKQTCEINLLKIYLNTDHVYRNGKIFQDRHKSL